MTTLSAMLDAALTSKPPGLLFHYTSSDGLVGILRAKEMWASNVAVLNDTKEIGHAIDYARNAIENKQRLGSLSASDILVLDEMHSYSPYAARRYYVVSFSEERDLLSQWRAYCPPLGGYSLGIPSQQLAVMSTAQGFTLTPCIYNHALQYQVVSEFIDSHLTKFRTLLASGADEEPLRKTIAWEFGQHLTRYGAAIKHPAFSEEREWRLISPMVQEPHPQLDYRGSAARVVPFFRFKLVDGAHSDLARCGGETLTVIVGPTSDTSSSQMTVQFLLTSLLGGAAHGVSAIPYRAW